MNVKMMKGISIGLIVLMLVSSLFFPWYSVKMSVMGESESEGINFFGGLESGWFFAVLCIVIELVLIVTALLAILGHLKDVRGNFMNTGLLVVLAAVLQLVFYLIAAGAVKGELAKELGGDYEMVISMVEMMGGKLRMGLTLWPFLNVVLAAGAFVCWTMYTKGSSSFSLADVQAAANDVRGFSQADIQAAVADARAAATVMASEIKDAASDVRQVVSGAVNAPAAPAAQAPAPAAQPGGWFCPSCGTPCAPTNKFCQKCGTRKPE